MLVWDVGLRTLFHSTSCRYVVLDVGLRTLLMMYSLFVWGGLGLLVLEVGLRTLFDDVVTFAMGGRPPPRERSRFFLGFRVVGSGWWVKDTLMC